MTTQISRVIVLTSDYNHATRRMVNALADDHGDVEFLVAVETRPFEFSRLLRNERRHLRRDGWRWILVRIGQVVGLVRNKIGGLLGGTRKTDQPASVPGHVAPANIAILDTLDLHSEQTLSDIGYFNPQLGISLGAPILKPALFEIPTLGTINLHQGKLPDYRGMPPAFWELTNGEELVGCSIHQVASALDQGAILVEDELRIKPHSTVGGLQLELNELSIFLLKTAFDELASGSARFVPQRPGGTTYRRPSLRQKSQLVRRNRSGLKAKQIVKNSVCWTYFHVLNKFAAVFRGKRNKQRVTVLLYHRVNDDLRDAVTVGIEQFDRHMQLISDHCDIVSIRDIVSGHIDRGSVRPIVAVTFDDGYADNYEIAAPILEKHNIPASFYVSTGKITTGASFEHDERRLGYGMPNMNWDQLRALRDRGFDIGSHTVSHINCAQSAPDVLADELEQSLAQIRDELGMADVHFAYPFGRRSDFNEEALAAVKNAGYSACLSAYDTYVDARVNRWNIPRVAIDHSFSDIAFLARVAGI